MTPSDPCYGASTYEEAKEICEQNELRLCSQEETIGGVCCQTGCSFDCKYIWVADSTGNHFVLKFYRNGPFNFVLLRMKSLNVHI